MAQATMLDGPSRRADSYGAVALDRPQGSVWELGSILPLLRVPKPGEALADDVRRLLDEDAALDEASDDPDPTRPDARPPGLAAGLALCVPALTVIGLLYTLLK